MNNVKKILFYADGASQEADALVRTVKLAKQLGASVKVMDIVSKVDTNDDNPVVIEAIEALQKNLIDQRASKMRGMVEQAGLDSENDLEILSGRDYVEIISAVQNDGFDLLVKSVNKPSLFSRALFGETDMKLLRKCPCPVWIIKPNQSETLSKILVAIDPLDAKHTELNKSLLDFASNLSEIEGTELVIMACWSMPFDISLKELLDEDKLDAIASGIVSQCENNLSLLVEPLKKDSYRVELINGEAEDVINEFVSKNNIDLVIMGTLARAGLPGLIIGNTAEKIIHNIDASVLALKPRGFKFR